MRNAYKIWLENLKERDLLEEIHISRWENSIKMGQKEIQYEEVNCICLPQDWDQWKTPVNKIIS
jgi:hypothetical protein